MRPSQCKHDHKRQPFVPQAHQTRVMVEFLASLARGILLFNDLGTGKTCTAYHAIDSYMEKFGPRRVHVFTPASLQAGHVTQYCDVCGHDNKTYPDYYRYYSTNDRRGIVEKMPENLDNSIIFVDESHEIINGKLRNSPTLTAVYDRILNARNSKVILASATPIFEQYGLALVINLLNPGSVPFNPEEFNRLVKNKDYIYLKVRGLISYVPAPNIEFYPARVKPDKIYKIPMSEYQFNIYQGVRDKELEDEQKLKQRMAKMYHAGTLKAGKSSFQFVQTAKILSRQICNFAYPLEIYDEIKARQYRADKKAEWMYDDNLEYVSKIKMFSPKMAQLIYNVLSIPNKHAIFTWFVSLYGVYLIYHFLYHCGLDPILYTGDISSSRQREEALALFNANDNLHGEKHKVIILSGAGAMGISVFDVRNFHVFDTALNEYYTVQVIGRVFRFMGHHRLPPDERNVQVHRYFTTLPRNARYKETKSSEEIVHEAALIRMKEAEEMLDIMKKGSFDCTESYNNIKGCYKYFGKAPVYEESKVIGITVEEDSEDPFADVKDTYVPTAKIQVVQKEEEPSEFVDDDPFAGEILDTLNEMEMGPDAL